MIQDIQHICITCRDIAKSISFYETLGLKVTEKIREMHEEALARAMQLPRGHIKVAHLAPPNATSNMFIDLVQWLEPSSIGEAYPALNNVGINRIALSVSDLDGTVKELQKGGIHFLTETAESFGPIRTIVTTDPDGVFVQLLEWL